MDHGKKDPVIAVTTVAKLHRLLHGRKRVLPVARTVMSGAEGTPDVPERGGKLRGLLCQRKRPIRVAELGVRAREQQLVQGIVTVGAVGRECQSLAVQLLCFLGSVACSQQGSQTEALESQLTP